MMATNLGTEVVSLKDVDFFPELLKTVPPNVARMYHCIPVALEEWNVAGGAGRSARPGASG